MERRMRMEILWVAAVFQLAMFTTATNTTDMTQVDAGAYAWSAWGSWSACSRTCGGGVAVQERECLPRSSSYLNTTLPTPVITVRVTRRVRSASCLGVDKRYHQCNTAPCIGGEPDMRAEQCSAYDRRPFRGRFYTWVPYIDGDSPCTLNCRPLGKHFYASLSLVADGTPCTRPGFRAICVQGTCKVTDIRWMSEGWRDHSRWRYMEAYVTGVLQADIMMITAAVLTISIGYWVSVLQSKAPLLCE